MWLVRLFFFFEDISQAGKGARWTELRQQNKVDNRALMLLETLFPRLCTCKENELSNSGPILPWPIVRLCALTCPRQGAFVGSVVSPATMSHPHEVISISLIHITGCSVTAGNH